MKSYLKPNVSVIDAANKVAAIAGDRNAPATFTYTFSLAKFIVTSLDLEEWPQESKVIEDELTWNEFVSLVENTLDCKFEVHYDSADKLKVFEIAALPGHRALYTKGYWTDYVVSTTVDESARDMNGTSMAGPHVFSVSLVGTPATVTVTVTATSTVTSEVQYGDPNDGGGGLSTGAKAGIGVGAGVGGLLVAAGIFILFWWRRRRKSQAVREISAVGPASALFLGGQGQGQEKMRPDSIPGPVPLLSEGGMSARRFELS